MDSLKIIETINSLFISVDNRDWKSVAETFHKKVELDYSSMGGGAPQILESKAIISSWMQILPGFDATHHQTGNFMVTVDKDVYFVFCYGTASHYLENQSENNIWTVVGSYNFEVKIYNNVPRITKMKFNLKFISGNNELPGLAKERIQSK